jgi:DNA-binding SARP family transcriptional activator/DNA-binding beta-propeller fold protein YncE
VDIRLLGVLEARSDRADAVPLPLGGPRQRAVLADLAWHVGQAVPVTQLIDDLWGDHPPASAKSTLETYVCRLRRILNVPGPARKRLVTRPGAYQLDAAPACVDVWRFRDLAARGSAALARGDPGTAVTLVAPALALWHGQALADIRDAPFAVLARHRLDEERLTAAENLMEARLALGEHRALVPELRALIAGSPYRERFRVQLMLALYRSGRQADALTAFAEARETLARELGIEPGPELTALQRAVLLQAPLLSPAAATAPQLAADPAGRPGRVLARQPSRTPASSWRGPAGRWAAVGAALAVTAALVLSMRPGTAAERGPAFGYGVGEVTANGLITHRLTLPDPPGSAVAADGSVWVTSPEADVVFRVDPVTDTLVRTIPVGVGPTAITATGPDIWVANTMDGTVSRISAVTDDVIQTIWAGVAPTGLVAGAGAIWVADEAASTLSALSPVSGQLIRTIALPAAPFGVAFGAGAVWVTSPRLGSITRVDPRRGRPDQPIPVGDDPTAIAFGFGSVWVADSLDRTVSRVDPGRAAVTEVIPVGSSPDAVAVAGGSVWSADRLASEVTRISAGNGRTAPVLVCGGPVALAAAADGVWVATRSSPARCGAGALHP